jgi:hypothetical protein
MAKKKKRKKRKEFNIFYRGAYKYRSLLTYISTPFHNFLPQFLCTSDVFNSSNVVPTAKLLKSGTNYNVSSTHFSYNSVTSAHPVAIFL